MKTLALWIVLAAAGVLLGTAICGCSVIGLAIDGSTPPDTLAASPSDKGLEGKNVQIAFQDGDNFTGQCLKVALLPPEMYRSRYKQWRDRPENKALSFSPGDTLVVAWEGGQTVKGSLEGFNQTSLVIRSFPKASLLRLRGSQLFFIPVGKVDSLVGSRGSTMSGSELCAQHDLGTVPTIDGMLVRKEGRSVWVPLDEIAEVREIRYSYDWLYKGAILDAVGLVAAAVYFSAKKQ